MSSLPPEDNKLITLAKAARARTGATEGAALRDLDGRTYAGGTVALPSLAVSAVGVVGNRPAPESRSTEGLQPD